MIAHSIRTHQQCVSYLRNKASIIFAQLGIPAISIISEKKFMPAGHRAMFIPSNLTIEISRQLVDLVADASNEVKVWNALNAIRHEIHHYHQYLRGVRKFTYTHEEEAQDVGRAYADESIRRLSKEEINPILADLAASALAGFGVAAGWKGFEWGLRKVTGKKAKRNPWLYPWQREKNPRLTPAQRKALDAYNFALKQEDRYLGSVFVTPMGQRRVEAKTKEAYDNCMRLGMTHEHGL